MGSHRQRCSHIKEKKSEHHIICRQTCNKTCTCLCLPCLPTCAWMCVSHSFLFFSLIFLFASCPCMLVPGSACLCLHPSVPSFLCLPLPANLHPTMPGHTCYGCPCLPACTMSLVSNFFFFTLYLCSHLQPTHIHVPLPCAHTSLCSCLLTHTHLPVPASCPASICLPAPCACQLAPNHAWPHLLWPPLPACLCNESDE